MATIIFCLLLCYALKLQHFRMVFWLSNRFSWKNSLVLKSIAFSRSMIHSIDFEMSFYTFTMKSFFLLNSISFGFNQWHILRHPVKAISFAWRVVADVSKRSIIVCSLTFQYFLSTLVLQPSLQAFSLYYISSNSTMGQFNGKCFVKNFDSLFN